MEEIKDILRRIWPLLLSGALLLTVGIWGVALGTVARGEASALSGALSTHETEASRELSALRETLAAIPTRTAREYLIRTAPGGIGIYNGAGTVLYELLSVDVTTLPAADRAMLEAGIIVTGEAALCAICADYTS